jgi:GTP-binding protein Era
VDAVVQVVDALAGVGRGDAFVAAHRVTPLPCRKICVVNKVDAVRRPRLVAQLDAAARLAPFDHVIPASAKEERGLDVLVDELVAVLPEGPASFAPGQVTDQSLEYRVAELIREKALALTREEVPHSVAVQIEELVQEGPVTRVSATLLVERDSQKGILIGKGGGMLKRIGTEARIEMEPLVGGRVFLDLRVKVLKEWQRDPAELTRLGY